MNTPGRLILESIIKLNTYKYENEEYYNIKDLLAINAYAKGSNASQDRLIRNKKYSPGSCIQGRISLDDITINIDLVISKKYTKKFVKKSEVLKDFNLKQSELNHQESVPFVNYLVYEEPPLINSSDNDLYMFKDKVEMRGSRCKQDILFKGVDIESLFGLTNIHDIVFKSNSEYVYKEDMLFCKKNDKSVSNNKELYLTFKGLQKIIRNNKTDSVIEFINWLDNITFSAMFGSEEQRLQTIQNIKNTTNSDVKINAESLYEENAKYKFELKLKESELKNAEEINKLKDEKIAMLEAAMLECKELYESKLELLKLKNNL